MSCLCRGRSSATSAARGHRLPFREISVQTNQLLHDFNEQGLAPRREKEFVCSGRLACMSNGGADRDRTGDLKLAKLALSQLSYGPSQGQLQSGLEVRIEFSSPGQVLGKELVGLGRLERPTSRLSGVRSNLLSYRPESPALMRDPKERETKTAVPRQNGM